MAYMIKSTLTWCILGIACGTPTSWVQQSLLRTEAEDQVESITVKPLGIFSHTGKDKPSAHATDKPTAHANDKPSAHAQKPIVPAGPSCGLTIDCPLNYSLSDVETHAMLAFKHRSRQSTNEEARKLAHKAALASCAGGKKSPGILCFDTVHSKAAKSIEGKHDVNYLIPEHHDYADDVIVSTLAKQVLLKPGGGCCYSLTDLGAGVGQLGHALKHLLPDLEYHGYDAAGNIEEFTDNFVNFGDVTLPLSVKRTDWVISTEVGQHIPSRFESQFMSNLHALNCKGIILTWAPPGQEGNCNSKMGHVNCHSNEYLKNLFEKLGYRYDTPITEHLRASRTHNKWLTQSSMAFIRTKTPPGCQ